MPSDASPTLGAAGLARLAVLVVSSLSSVSVAVCRPPARRRRRPPRRRRRRAPPSPSPESSESPSLVGLGLLGPRRPRSRRSSSWRARRARVATVGLAGLPAPRGLAPAACPALVAPWRRSLLGRLLPGAAAFFSGAWNSTIGRGRGIGVLRCASSSALGSGTAAAAFLRDAAFFLGLARSALLARRRLPRRPSALGRDLARLFGRPSWRSSSSPWSSWPAVFLAAVFFAAAFFAGAVGVGSWAGAAAGSGSVRGGRSTAVGLGVGAAVGRWCRWCRRCRALVSPSCTVTWLSPTRRCWSRRTASGRALRRTTKAFGRRRHPPRHRVTCVIPSHQPRSPGCVSCNEAVTFTAQPRRGRVPTDHPPCRSPRPTVPGPVAAARRR